MAAYNSFGRYIFGIGLSIAIICVILALSVEDVPYYVQELRSRFGRDTTKRGQSRAVPRNIPTNPILVASTKVETLSDVSDAHQTSRLRQNRFHDLESGAL